MPFKSIKNERGMALALVIMVMTVLIILGASILTSSLTETKFSVANEKNLQAEYIAKEGADIIAQHFITSKDENAEGTTTMALGIGESAGQAEVQVSSIGGIYKIQSTGGVGNAQRTVKLYLRPLKLDEVFKGIWQTAEQALNISKLAVTGDPIMQVPPGVTVTNSKSGSTTTEYKTSNLRSVDDMISKLDLPPAGGATTGSITITGNCRYPIINAVTKITIDAPNVTNTSILIDEISDSDHQIGEINVSSSGIVHLFINDSVLLKSSVKCNGTLIIYIANDETIDMQTGNDNIKMYIYAPDATVELQCGNKALIGAVVARTFVKLNDNPSNAELNFVSIDKTAQDIYINFDGGKMGYVKDYYSK